MQVTIEDPYWLGYLQQVNQIYFQVEQQVVGQTTTLYVALYLRVSTEEQAQEGFSIEEQQRECQAFAQRQGWQIYEVYIDDGYSGTNGDRPALQRLLQDAEAGKFQGVVTHKIDRAYRNAQGMLRTFSDWQRQGIFFASVKEQIDFTTPWGKLILGVLSLLAEVFVDNLREETKKGKRGRFHNGLHNGPLPWGYCSGHCSNCTDPNGPGYCPRTGLTDLRHGKPAVPHPVDSLAFREAHRHYRSGEYSDKQIAEFLNAYQVTGFNGEIIQVRSKGKPGQAPGPFTKDSVREMLQNPFYAGIVPYRGSIFDGEKVIKISRPQDINQGKHLPLISRIEFEEGLQVRGTKSKAPQGQGRSDQAPRGKTAPRRAARVYVLQGLLDCGRCGAPMHSQAGGANARRHICSTRLQRQGKCDQPSIKADLLETELAAQMAQIDLPANWQEDIIGYMLDRNGLGAIAAQQQALQAHFAGVKVAYEQGQLGRQIYLQERRAFERGLAALSLDHRTDIDLAQARSLLGDFGRLWSLLKPLDQKELARTLLQAATLEADQITEWRWYPAFASLFAAS